DAAARPLQADAREEEIGAAGGGVEAWVPQIGKSVGPGLFLQEDHLAAAPLVGVAHQALAGLQGGGLGRVHGASLEALQPDGADLSGTAGPHFTGAGEVKTASASCAGAEMSPSSSFLSSPTWLRCGASMMLPYFCQPSHFQTLGGSSFFMLSRTKAQRSIRWV